MKSRGMSKGGKCQSNGEFQMKGIHQMKGFSKRVASKCDKRGVKAKLMSTERKY